MDVGCIDMDGSMEGDSTAPYERTGAITVNERLVLKMLVANEFTTFTKGALKVRNFFFEKQLQHCCICLNSS